MSLLEPNNPTLADSESCNVAKAQVKGLKIAFINTIEVLAKEVNKSIKEIFEKSNMKRK